MSRNFVDLTQDNSMRARVKRHIKIKQGDFFRLPAHASTGILLSNLPYSERLKTSESDSEMKDYYGLLGDKLKKDYQGWRIGLLVKA